MASKQLVELIPDLADEISARNAMRALANISTLGRYVQVDVRDRFLEYCKNFIEKAPESNSIHTRAEVDRLAHNIRCLPIKSAPMLIDSFLPLSGSTPADSEVDFVFIHGLRGGLKTWRVLNRPGDTEIKLWPSLCLSDCFPAVRLLAFTYEAPLWYATHKQHYSEVDVKRNFDEMALSLRSALSDAGVGRNGKKVVFITFSMGGLVAKRALVDDEQLRNNTLGVVFFATPHLGSPIADYAYYTSVGGLLVSPFVEDLSRKSKQVLSLHEAYQDTCQQIPSLSVCETAQADIGAGIKAMVVPYESCSACSENAMSSAMVAGNNVDHEAVPKIPADLVCHDHRVVALMEFLNRIIARHQHNHN
jgi:pimeloyl-ACP methyl ester carboxylesterase